MFQTSKNSVPILKKRDGRTESYTGSKIKRYLSNLASKAPRLAAIDVDKIVGRLASTMSMSMSTEQLATYLSEICAALTVEHWQYGALGGRVCVSTLHRSTPVSFSDCVRQLSDVLSPDFVQTVIDNEGELNAMIDLDRDFQYDVMGFKTLERSYLLKKQGVVVERPQYMLMRVAVALHQNDLAQVRETYEATSRLLYTHATPTLFHAGFAHGQLASCYLLTVTEDSIEGIFETLKRCALISKGAGGIGLSVSNIRAKNSLIQRTNGVSNGLTPMLRVFNDTARYVDQGGGKRKGSFAIYLEPHHPDILDFLELKKNHGVEAEKARDLFYGLWISDLFMKRVKAGQPWSVICPTQCPQLQDAYGEEYERLYQECEQAGHVTKTFDNAREVWFAILDAQIETGTPYMMYKDHCNRKSNQQNLGTIRGSNLCVAPETRILTSTGWQQISKLENQDVTVWNGQEWSETRVVQTGQDQPLMTVRLSNGSVLHCTEYHKFYNHNKHCVRAHELKAGMKLLKCSYPVVDTGTALIDAYVRGLCCADGTVKRINKSMIPQTANLDSKTRWLTGYLDGCSSVIDHGQYETIRTDSISVEFLHELLMMLQTMGVHATISDSRLLIASDGCQQLVSMGFAPKRLVLKPIQCSEHEQEFVKVVSAELSERRDDTYCFTETKRGMGMFEGVLTGQCCEIVEYTSPDEAAVCTLASVALPKCVERQQFDFRQLERVVRLATRNLNITIDLNHYPLPQAQRSNLRHRPIGIGVQGLADVFATLGHPYESPEARLLNKHIFETIYYAALSESCLLAQRDGPYETFAGSPFSQGRTQIELWGVEQDDSRHQWSTLRQHIQQFGTRNSLLTAPMPTASTAQILGNTESFEPRTSNLYTRRVLSGEYIVINRYLQEALLKRGAWSEKMAKQLIAHRGSVQKIPGVPDDIKAVFKTVWEISQRSVIDMAADRGIYIDQSQSLNLHVEEPTRALLTSMHFYGWEKGLKTGQYYLRMQPKAKAMQFTVAPSQPICEEEVCLMCSS